MPKRVSDEKWQAFLDELRRTGLRTVAARHAGISVTAPHMRAKLDEEFAQAMAEAIEESAELLELEARRRAYDGVEREKVIGSGDSARHIVEVHYSDPLLITLLKANNPDKFKERSSSEISGPGGEPMQLNDTGAAARLAAIFEAAKRRRDGQADDDVDPFA